MSFSPFLNSFMDEPSERMTDGSRFPKIRSAMKRMRSSSVGPGVINAIMALGSFPDVAVNHVHVVCRDEAMVASTLRACLCDFGKFLASCQARTTCATDRVTHALRSSWHSTTQ